MLIMKATKSKRVIVIGRLDVIERANSQAKLIMTDKSERLAPETLDMLMIYSCLKFF